jgi:trimethylamine--corrinoid protein Co-methyltransferase
MNGKEKTKQDSTGFKVLSEEVIGRIHEATLEVLEKHGVWFPGCSEALDLFRKNGCRIDGDRVMIPPELFGACIKILPDRDKLGICVAKLGMSETTGLKQGESHVGLIGNPYYLYEYGKGERDLIDSDRDDKFLVMDYLSNLTHDCCCLLTALQRDANAVFPDYNDTRVCADYLRRRVGSRPSCPRKKLAIHSNIMHGSEPNPILLSPKMYKPLEKMELLRHAILCGPGQTSELLAHDTPLVWCNPTSPLQYHPDEVRAIMRAIEDLGRSCFIMISPEVMIGATGPVTLEGSLIQHNAEVMAGVILTQLHAPGTAAIYGCVSGVMDLRVGEIALGNFESAAFNVGIVQLADYYGLPSRIQSGNTNARSVGVRSAVETAWGLQMGIAAGANLVHTGLLDCTLMLSLEHLVLVDEMVSQIRSGMKIGNMDSDHTALDVIHQEGRPGTQYMSHSHTTEHMKEVVHYSDFTGRVAKSYNDWYATAHEKVEAILKREYSAENKKMVEEKLLAVEARLRENDTTWRSAADDWWHFYVQDLR